MQRGGLRSWRRRSRAGLPAVVLTGCRLKHGQRSARSGRSCQAAWGQRLAQDCGCPVSAQKQLGLYRKVEKGVDLSLNKSCNKVTPNGEKIK